MSDKYPYEVELEILDKLEKLQVSDTDILYVKIDNPETRHSVMPFLEHLKGKIRELYAIENPLIVIGVGEMDFETLDEDKMLEHGWVRAGMDEIIDDEEQAFV